MSCRRVRVIANPLAGRPPDQRRLTDALARLERRGWRVEQDSTERPGHAQELAAGAAYAGFDAVLACGGDGTINEVVNGLAGSETAMAVLPAGTVNVWAREARIGRDPETAVALLEDGERHRVDLGRVRDRYFLMLASVGVDSRAVRAITAAQKRRWGQGAYVAAGLRALYGQGGPELWIRADGRAFRGRALTAIVGNTRLYGGVLTSARHARLDDGLLDLCAYPGGGPFRLAAHLVRTLVGRHVNGGHAIYVQARRITLDGPEPLPVQADGEDIGDTPVTFEAVAAALTVILPPGLRTPLLKQSPP